MLSYEDFCKRPKYIPKLPYEEPNLEKYFNNAKIWINATKNNYLVVNGAKGGVIKLFDKKNNKLIFNDCGYVGLLKSKKMISTQWIDKEYKVIFKNSKITITGQFNQIPSNKNFNLVKNLIFRIVLLLIGWNSNLSHILKGSIRKILMLGNRRTGIFFKRTVTFSTKKMMVVDKIANESGRNFKELSYGGEFFLRYVPQSRYFQSQELDFQSKSINQKHIDDLNNKKSWNKTQNVFFKK